LLAPAVAILLGMLTTILITGAFHEDGLSDTCDGFGGGWNRTQVLTIMKDSRVGAYGVIGIVFALGFKFALLQALPPNLIPCSLVIAHTVSRFVAVSFIFTHDYARDDDSSKVRPLAYRMRGSDLALAAATAGLCLMLLLPSYIFVILLPLLLLRVVVSRVLLFPLGGYTGDVLGAIQQLSEIAVYLAISAAANNLSST
jgi:adenosylcobinamide-GDP ribazoletransferase